MNIPKYVIDILERAKYSYGANSVPGYTIAIEKQTQYKRASTLDSEARRLVKWANREYQKLSKDDTAIAMIDSVPAETVYKYKQYATVTIFDPIMQHIEKHIKG